jgi:membrane protein DedA with SNARE-associated domain
MVIDFLHLLQSSSYWGVLLFTTIEGTGIPFPPAKLFIVAAIYAGTSHHLSLPLLLGAAIGGTLAGNTASFWAGRRGGERLLRRANRLPRHLERRLKLGQGVFRTYGGGIVCFGHFVPALRLWVALLAGVGAIRWSAFLLWNTLGILGWAVLYGVGGYVLGDEINRVGTVVGPALLIFTLMGLLVGWIWLRRYEKRLAMEAECVLREASGDPSPQEVPATRPEQGGA